MSKTKEFDLTEVLFQERRKPRGDEASAHAADIHGCDRATWYRRKGFIRLPFTPAKLALFDQGHAYEEGVRQRLISAGHAVGADTVEVFGLIGHTDMTYSARKLVIDAKLSINAPAKTFPSPHYIVATAGYVLSYGWKRGIVLHGNAKVGIGIIETAWEFDVDDLAHDVKGNLFGGRWEGYTWRRIVADRAAEPQ